MVEEIVSGTSFAFRAPCGVKHDDSRGADCLVTAAHRSEPGTAKLAAISASTIDAHNKSGIWISRLRTGIERAWRRNSDTGTLTQSFPLGLRVSGAVKVAVQCSGTAIDLNTSLGVNNDEARLLREGPRDQCRRYDFSTGMMASQLHDGAADNCRQEPEQRARCGPAAQGSADSRYPARKCRHRSGERKCDPREQAQRERH
jgi:hypothetical protein